MDFNYILKRIIIGTGIALAIMFIKDEVLAATTIQAYQYRTTYTACTPISVGGVNMGCSPTGNEVTSSLTPFGTATAGPKIIHSNTFMFATPNDSSKMFIQGQQCQIKFTVNWNPRDQQAQSNALEGVPVFQYYNGSNYVNFTDATLNRSLSNDNYGIDYFYNFTVPQTSRYMQVVLDYPSDIVRYSSSEGLNVVRGSINCATSSTDIAIQDAGNQITGAIEGAGTIAHQDATDIKSLMQNFMSKFDNAFGGDDSSHGTVGGAIDPYASSGLEQKEGQIDWTVSDNAFDLDLTPFTGPMQFIWLQVNTFISLDPLFMSAILVMLTITFAALVVGRL